MSGGSRFSIRAVISDRSTPWPFTGLFLGLVTGGLPDLGDPGVVDEAVVDGGVLLRLLLRALRLGELGDAVLLEHPVVDAPLAPVVERRLLALRREDARVLEHVEGVAVLRLEHVVD